MIKNIILTSAVDNENYKGMITLENTQNKVLITLKTYNLPISHNKKVLGVLINGDLFKVELNDSESYLIDKSLDLKNKISVVLLEIENQNSKILLWGSNETTRVWKNSIMDCFKDDEESQTKNNHILDFEIENESMQNNKNIIANDFIEKVYAESKEDDYESDEYIENLVDLNFKDDYDILNENKKDIKDNKSEFFLSIESQIEELLNNYEEEKALEEIIPNSKFVKVDLEKNGNFYVFGVIYENTEIKYIVYGLPGEFSVKPDDEYSKYYQWLPLNSENPESYGYYLMYQDAIDGNQIEMIID